MWHNSRQLIRPQFIKDRVSDLHTFETHFEALLPLLQGSQPGSTVRIDDLFFRFTLDAATDFLLGDSVNSLENPQAEFANAFTAVQHTQAVIARAGPMQSFVPKKKFHEGLKVLNAFVEKYIDQALALSPAELEAKTKSDQGYTFLHALASYTRDRTVLRDQLVAILLAGRDTTAVSLSWLFYSLSQNPEVVDTLRREVIATLGSDPTVQPTYEHLKSMRYLQHTLNETLRLYPVVPYNVRVALNDTTLPRGGGKDGMEPVAVLKDTPIGYSTLILQHRADLYPSHYPSDPEKAFPDPEKFDPSRWNSWTPKSWTYVPFNGGPRICIGQQFALTEMGYTVVRILQQFSRVEDRSGGEFPGWRTDIVLQPANGVKVAFTR
jgi:cytochrome P450